MKRCVSSTSDGYGVPAGGDDRLSTVSDGNGCSQSLGVTNQNGFRYDRKFSVVYGKVSTRKHKKFEGDGILLCKDRIAVLKTEDGTDVARTSAFVKSSHELTDGSRVIVGGYEIEIQNEIMLPGTSLEVAKSSEEPTCSLISGVQSSPPKKKFIPVARFVQPFAAETQKQNSSEFIVNQKDVENGLPAVVLDGRIAYHLRPHQRDGIRFLYERLKDPGGGVVLADEMGLGKSVQTISLITSLIRKTGRARSSEEKYLLLVPSSLLGNWQCEFRKWLPHSSALLFHVSKASELERYMRSVRCSPIAMMSYEMAAYIGEPLTQVAFALVACDEAHRLKNHNGRLHRMVRSLQTERRLLLTGTPLQNDSNELFAILDLARPGAFGTLSEFNKLFDNNAEEPTFLRDLLPDVLLRRTAEVNRDYLPVKHEYLLFCRMSELQRSIYVRIKDFVTSDHLAVIDMLKKLCNHPAILYQSICAKRDRTAEGKDDPLHSRVLDVFPASFGRHGLSVSDSGKLSVFLELMVAIREMNEKVVIVSNFTKTLDMLNALCECLYFTIFRLDGSVLQQKRMQIVNEFNSSPNYNSVFLLSTKAGGVGLNLIGATRLIVFDSEWNPAIDAQAMARIWRDGQTKPCHIYRLITSGTIDEKILQRQVMKSGLSTVIELEQLAESAMTQFSDEDLSDIFSLDCETMCNTHDLMECECEGCGLLPCEREALEEDAENETLPCGSAASKNIDDPSAADGKENANLESCENQSSVTTALNADNNFDQARTSKPKDNTIAATRDDRKKQLNYGSAKSGSVAGEKSLPPNVAMAALLQWRHYSQKHPEQFGLFSVKAGLGNCNLVDLTFAMKTVRNY